MSIKSEYREIRSLTTEENALQAFTDRTNLIAQFLDAINEDPSPNQIIFFYGDGGNGKSLLLKYLKEFYCRRFLPETWQSLKALPQEDRVHSVIQATTAQCLITPSALLDFSQSTLENEHPQDPYTGLLLLREQLAKQGVSFPRLNFACTWYLKQKGKLTPDKIASLCPTEEMFLLDVIVSKTHLLFPFLGWVGLVGHLTTTLLKYFGKYLSFILDRRGIETELQRQIKQIDVDRELLDLMPQLFARDLNDALKKNKGPKRIVLFFDTHEAFWGNERQLSDSLYFQRDQWLRSLLRNLELVDGVMVIAAGREPPKWFDASKENIPASYILAQDIGFFEQKDAFKYLERVKLSDSPLSSHMIHYASIDEGMVHPLYLGLCADMVRAAELNGYQLNPEDFSTSHRGVHQARDILSRLLQYVNVEIRDAVAAMGACRVFDLNLYLFLGQKLNFQSTSSGFRVLTQFSFVWQDQQRGQSWYRINSLIRRLDHKTNNELTYQAHRVLEEYYREQGDLTETIYHSNCLDWYRGIQDWLQNFDRALRHSDYERCRRLLDLQNDLSIESDRVHGQVSLTMGTYFEQLAKYDEAKQAYQSAIQWFNSSLHANSEASTYNIQGNTFLRLGIMKSRLAEDDAVLPAYTDAIASYEQALAIDSTLFSAISNTGLVQAKIGELLSRKATAEEARQAYEKSIRAYNQALEINPQSIQTHNGKGNVLVKFGEFISNENNDDAIAVFHEAIASYNLALSHSPDYVMAHNNRGLALQGLADRQEPTIALKTYQQAIAAFSKVLTLAPDLGAAKNNQGFLFSRIASCQVALNQVDEAIASYRQAIEFCEQALETAPDFVDAHETLGTIFRELGMLQVQQSQERQGQNSFAQAIASYDQVLAIAPKHRAARTGKGMTYIELGDSQVGGSKQQEAHESWQVAERELAIALEHYPHDQEIRDVYEQIQRRLKPEEISDS